MESRCDRIMDLLNSSGLLWYSVSFLWNNDHITSCLGERWRAATVTWLRSKMPCAANVTSWPTMRKGKDLRQTQYDPSNYEVLPAWDLKSSTQQIQVPMKVVWWRMAPRPWRPQRLLLESASDAEASYCLRMQRKRWRMWCQSCSGRSILPCILRSSVE